MLNEPLTRVLGAVALVLSYYVWQRKRLPLPPGPSPRLFIGNLHQIPTNHPWLTYAEWSKKYGPIFTLRIFSQTHIVLNSSKAVLDLLEARSAIYSDRPVSWMLSNLAGRTVFQLSFLDSHFPKYRKMLHSGLNKRATKAYRPIQNHQLKILLQGLVESPNEFPASIKRYVAGIALKIAYGYDVSSDNDYFVGLAEQNARAAASVLQPFFWVETFPFLRFIPSWFPFATFKRTMFEAKKVIDVVEAVPFEWAKEKIASGNYTDSFFSQYFRPDEDSPLDDEDWRNLKWTSASIYSGGAHTTAAAMTTFFLLMSQNPEIQKTAQAEIDKATGRERLLNGDDQASLPYVTALLKETLRFAPVAPLGLMHRVIKDDIYEGYFIPKGATVIANIWAITHDSESYPDPFTFDPTRHLGDKPQPDPFQFVFGYGRRVCPGAALGEESLFLAVANILASFNISKAVDAEGNEIEPAFEWFSSVVTYPTNFGCRISPRFPETLTALTQTEEI
ncbi:Cytochrome P450 [Mycena venus]|uniref:Cytochrome P450 n=1 Tax=Mycena venus TaxID=2733690 RepID=A0A8H7CWA2_9AGAR|nr:Cytochrome P450 [Mycena venus]